MSCFDSEEAAAWASGRLEAVQAQRFRAHLAECSECRLLCDLLERGRPASTRPASLKPGARLGPYQLLEWVGQGGMGDVFAAYDARLDRRVALKVLGGDGPSNARILHEARAMAQLRYSGRLTAVVAVQVPCG